MLDDDLTPNLSALATIQALSGLQELSMPQWIPLDFSGFPKLQSLVLSKGNTLRGLHKLTSLKLLYLINWQTSELPKEIASISAREVRISASLKLTRIDALLKSAALRDLTLQHLPKLAAPAKSLKLNQITRLNVEKIAWQDYGCLHSNTLRDLELFTKFESLAFIKQLPALKRLYVWECVDGNMRPVLSHPSLRELYFDKNRKHYTLKESALQAQLQLPLRAR